MRIVLGNGSLINTPRGGGHWSWFLQYPLGLKDLGHEVLWLELMRTTGQPDADRRIVRDFFQRAAPYGLDHNCAVLIFDGSLDSQLFERAEVMGASRESVRRAIGDADLLLNFCCAIRQPMLSMFRRRALLDFDPGHLQISALSWELNIADHDILMTIGARINEPDCEVPKLGRRWCTFEPCVYLPMWPMQTPAPAAAPFSTVTHWTWELLKWRGGTLSVSKRTAYLNYVGIPRRARRPFEIAAYIEPGDTTGDREQIEGNEWRLVHPLDVAGSVNDYMNFIRRSRAEFLCPKPIHVQLRTGWFSDRSIAYLASGRPVLAEETGFSEHIATGRGILAFRTMDEAVAGVAEIDAKYARHSRAAREIAEELFDSRKCLQALLEACDR